MSPSLVKSATRAIEVLEYFKLSQQPRSMSELAADLGYPQSSTTVLLKTLVKLGYLNFDRQNRVYFPTPKVTSLGEWIPKVLFGSGKIIAAMKDVHAATGEGVFLGTKNDVYLQYMTTLPSIHALRFHIDEAPFVPSRDPRRAGYCSPACPTSRSTTSCGVPTSRPRTLPSGCRCATSWSGSRKFVPAAMRAWRTFRFRAAAPSQSYCRRRCRGNQSRSRSVVLPSACAGILIDISRR